jgi:hypothetical protein
MGFAARLTAARAAQEALQGPISMDQATKMIHTAISKAVNTNKLESICTAKEVMDTAKHLGKHWDLNAFCEKYAMPPEIAVDLLQARANIHQVPIAFIMRLLYVLWFLALLLPSIVQLFKTLVVALSI